MWRKHYWKGGGTLQIKLYNMTKKILDITWENEKKNSHRLLNLIRFKCYQPKGAPREFSLRGPHCKKKKKSRAQYVKVLQVSKKVRKKFQKSIRELKEFSSRLQIVNFNDLEHRRGPAFEILPQNQIILLHLKLLTTHYKTSLLWTPTLPQNKPKLSRKNTDLNNRQTTKPNSNTKP